MADFRFRLAAVLLLAGTAVSLHAQLPGDSEAYKARCALLASQSNAVLSGTTPAALVSATRSIRGDKFYALAVNRSQAGYHYIACTLYSLAAIAERAGNSGQHNYKAANDDLILAAAELRLAHHQHLLMAQHVKRVEMKIDAIGSTLSLNSDETGQVLDAAGTTPITLAPPDPALQRAMAPTH